MAGENHNKTGGTTPRYCITPGCPNLATNTSQAKARCKQCEQTRNKQRNNKPNRQAYKDPTYKQIKPGPRCAHCGTTNNLTKDHITPLTKGGTNHPTNIQTLCRQCNSRKKDHHTDRGQ